MGRGFISGVLWGSLLSVLSLWGLSQIGGPVHILSETPAEVGDMSPIPGDIDIVENSGDIPVAPDAQASPSTDPSRQGTPPVAAQTETTPSTDTTTATVPETGETVREQAAPETESAPLVVANNDSTVASAGSGANTGTIAEAPVSEMSPQVVTQTPAPPAVPQESDVPEIPDVNTEPAQVSPQPESEQLQTPEPVQPTAPQVDVVPDNDFSTPKVIDTPVPEAEVPVVPETEGSENSEQDTATQSTGTAVVVDRTSRSSDETPETEENAQPLDETTDEPGVVTGPAIQTFAQEFENLEARPLMAIILLVDGDRSGVGEAITPLPFPVSYVVDASKDNAGSLMAAYRANGNEVIALTPLPEGAAPKDVEVAFQSYLKAVPEAVAVMDVPAAVFQSGRSVATHVSEVLAASGHGMITYSRGLNSATQVAERSGVPAALVFRVFDDNNRDGSAIKRFLDQAAFRAGQQTGVILVGHDRPETVTALLEWGLGNRASTVALAPVSAALTSQ